MTLTEYKEKKLQDPAFKEEYEAIMRELGDTVFTRAEILDEEETEKLFNFLEAETEKIDAADH